MQFSVAVACSLTLGSYVALVEAFPRCPNMNQTVRLNVVHYMTCYACERHLLHRFCNTPCGQCNVTWDIWLFTALRPGAGTADRIGIKTTFSSGYKDIQLHPEKPGHFIDEGSIERGKLPRNRPYNETDIVNIEVALSRPNGTAGDWYNVLYVFQNSSKFGKCAFADFSRGMRDDGKPEGTWTSPQEDFFNNVESKNQAWFEIPSKLYRSGSQTNMEQGVMSYEDCIDRIKEAETTQLSWFLPEKRTEVKAKVIEFGKTWDYVYSLPGSLFGIG